MILGLGADLCDIRRIEKAIERHGDRFIDRIFTAEERAEAERRTPKNRPSAYAKRFAAKEAASKALSTGFAGGVFFSDLGVVNLPGGKPTRDHPRWDGSPSASDHDRRIPLRLRAGHH
jgi:holo-[acyl-carrier protein] synthase